MNSTNRRNIKITVEQGNALAIQADVLALKYANALYGADRAAVHALIPVIPDIQERLPKTSGFYLTPAQNAITSKRVIFVGVGSLRQFGYKEIRLFGRKVLEALAGEAPEVQHVVLTIHGPVMV